MKRGIFADKKGQVEKSIEEIGYLVLVFGLILLSVYILYTLLFSSSTPVDQQEAVNNFRELGRQVDLLLMSDNKFETTKMQYSLPKGYILVGFDKDWRGDMEDDSAISGYPFGTIKDDKVEADWCSDGEGIEKPSQCQDAACICLYKETRIGDDFMEEGRDKDDVLDCVQFNENVVISALRDSEEGYFTENNGLIDGAMKYLPPKPPFDAQEYEFLVAYGSCDGAFGIQRVYLEKYKEDKNTYILFTPITPENNVTIQKREEELSKRFSVSKNLTQNATI